MRTFCVVGLVLGFCMFAFAFGEDTTKAICWVQVVIGLVGMGIIFLSAHYLERLNRKRRLYRGKALD